MELEENVKKKTRNKEIHKIGKQKYVKQQCNKLMKGYEKNKTYKK